MATAPSVGPLDELTRLVREAQKLPRALPYERPANPLAHLLDVLSGRPDDDAPGTPAIPAAAPTAAAATSIEGLVGREVLALVSSRPLSPAARAEAVRRLVVAAQNPSSDNIRSALAVLLADSEDA